MAGTEPHAPRGAAGHGPNWDHGQYVVFNCDMRSMGECKSISSIDTGQASIAHGAKTDSDLARLPGVNHPAAGEQHASQGFLTWSAARRGQSAAQQAHPRPSDTECSKMRLPGRLWDRGGAGRRRT